MKIIYIYMSKLLHFFAYVTEIGGLAQGLKAARKFK